MISTANRGELEGVRARWGQSPKSLVDVELEDGYADEWARWGLGDAHSRIDPLRDERSCAGSVTEIEGRGAAFLRDSSPPCG